MEDAKRCARCHESKPRTEFGVGKKWTDGLYPYCRPCSNEYQRRRADANRDAHNAYQRAYYKAKPETAKRNAVRWHKANSAYRTAWAVDNP